MNKFWFLVIYFAYFNIVLQSASSSVTVMLSKVVSGFFGGQFESLQVKKKTGLLQAATVLSSFLFSHIVISWA
jgi:hypothetical protein